MSSNAKGGIYNRKAHFEYALEESFLAGIVLTGPEVKSVRLGHGSLSGSFVKIIGGEVFLVNAQISPYKHADNRDYDPKRTRKLLLSRSEIIKLQTADEKKGAVLVPMALKVVRRYIKVEVAVGKGKRQFEKRAAMRERDVARDVARQFKDKVTLK